MGDPGAAIISPCGKYRYVLRRSLGSILRWHRPILFVMLNPSTADSHKDDPTIRRCMAFAKREGCTQLTVVNLFALRATDPKELKMASDPVGPANDDYLRDEINQHQISPIVCAWGAHPIATLRAAEVLKKFEADLCCLGTTKKGAPRHPLYVKSDQPLERYGHTE